MKAFIVVKLTDGHIQRKQKYNWLSDQQLPRPTQSDTHRPTESLLSPIII